MSERNLILVWKFGMQTNENRDLLSLFSDRCLQTFYVAVHAVLNKRRFYNAGVKLEYRLAFHQALFYLIGSEAAVVQISDRPLDS